MKPTIEERFWAKVLKLESGCWEWQASKFWTGYGQFKMNGKNRIAHRVSYEFANGLLDDGLVVSHTCKNDACVNPAHLEAAERQMTEAEFWANVTKSESGCWEWQSSKFNTGYGQCNLNGKPQTTHRVAYELSKGPIPKGIFVCHTCDNPPCINPEHLFLGTPKQNTQDMISKGRSTLRPMTSGPRGPYKKKR